MLKKLCHPVSFSPFEVGCTGWTWAMGSVHLNLFGPEDIYVISFLFLSVSEGCFSLPSLFNTNCVPGFVLGEIFRFLKNRM